MMQNIQIRRSQRAKRIRIIVTPEKIEVVAPLRLSEKKIRQFMQAKQDWILSAHKKVQQSVASKVSFAPDSYQTGALIPYQGKQYLLEVKESQCAEIKIDFFKKFMAYVPEGFSQQYSVKERSELLKQEISVWMMDLAVKQSAVYMDRFSFLYQLYPRSITIKTQKSRWGSCGIQGDIYLNWLLILAPVKVFEYVVVHELCHIEQRNHSADFWGLVARHCPDYKQYRLWLKENGTSLMLGL